MKKQYAIVDHDIDAVWGIGDTIVEAISDASCWLCDDNGCQGISAEDVKQMLEQHDLYLIDSDDDEWDDYIKI